VDTTNVDSRAPIYIALHVRSPLSQIRQVPSIRVRGGDPSIIGVILSRFIGDHIPNTAVIMISYHQPSNTCYQTAPKSCSRAV
jgi:hypothetical protein